MTSAGTESTSESERSSANRILTVADKGMEAYEQAASVRYWEDNNYEEKYGAMTPEKLAQHIRKSLDKKGFIYHDGDVEDIKRLIFRINIIARKPRPDLSSRGRQRKIDLLIEAICGCEGSFDDKSNANERKNKLKQYIVYDDRFTPEVAERLGVSDAMIISNSGLSLWGVPNYGHDRNRKPTLSSVVDLESYLRRRSDALIEQRGNEYMRHSLKEYVSRNDKGSEYTKALKEHGKISRAVKTKERLARDRYLLSEDFIKVKNELDIDKKPTRAEAIALAETI